MLISLINLINIATSVYLSLSWKRFYKVFFLLNIKFHLNIMKAMDSATQCSHSFDLVLDRLHHTNKKILFVWTIESGISDP